MVSAEKDRRKDKGVACKFPITVHLLGHSKGSHSTRSNGHGHNGRQRDAPNSNQDAPPRVRKGAMRRRPTTQKATSLISLTAPEKLKEAPRTTKATGVVQAAS